MQITPVLLCGGSGTRLWPLSRQSYPKQFARLLGAESLFQASARRLTGPAFTPPVVVTGHDFRFIATEQLAAIETAAAGILIEPEGRNTAAAVLAAALWLSGTDPDAAMIVAPSDHAIPDADAFRRAVEAALPRVAAGDLVTFGITPDRPETGYGYIEVTENEVGSGDHLKAFEVEGFREKPDETTASEFLKTGKHFWNAGMFLFKVSHMIELFQEHQPDMWSRVATIKSDLSNAKYVYANLEAISLDYAIMEKVKEQVCIPCDMGWSDVGSWDELARLGEEMPSLRNVGAAQVFNEASRNNYVFSIRNKVIGLVGIENSIVVDTPDALLVAAKGQSQKVKDVLQQIKEAGLPEATEHPFETRPWGRYEVVCDRKDFKSKVITVHAGHQLSYQSHTKRSEHWVVISGEAEVVLNDEVHKLGPGDAISIPVGAKHRMRNPGTRPLIFTETQTGSYFGEDDITRYEDDYSRI